MLSNQHRPHYLNHAHTSNNPMMPGVNQQNGGLADRKPSKLEQMRADYQKKILKEKEEKMIHMYEETQKKAMSRVTRNGSGIPAFVPDPGNGAVSPNGGKSVRDFFNERRRMEASGVPVPPIDNHYKQAKGYNSPGGWSSRAGSGNSMKMKGSAGRDRAQPLAPIRRPLDTQEVANNNNNFRSGIPQRQNVPQANGYGEGSPFHDRPRLVKHKPLPPTSNNHQIDDNNNDGSFQNARPVKPSNLPKYSPQHRKPHPPQQPPQHQQQQHIQQHYQQQQQQHQQQQHQQQRQVRQPQPPPNAAGKPRYGAAAQRSQAGGQEKLTDFQKWQAEQNKSREDRLKRLNTQKNPAPFDAGVWRHPDEDDDEGDDYRNGGNDHDNVMHSARTGGNNDDDEEEDEDVGNDGNEDDGLEEEIRAKERELMEKIAQEQKKLESLRKERAKEEEEEKRELEKMKKKEAMDRARQKKLDEERRKEEERLRKEEEEEERREKQRFEKQRKEDEKQRKEEDKQRKEDERRRQQEEKQRLKRQKDEEKRLAKQQGKLSSRREDYSPHTFDEDSPLPSARRTATIPKNSREPPPPKPQTEEYDIDERRLSYSDAAMYEQAARSSDARGAIGSLASCQVCGRKFAADRLQKHQNACKKANKPRKEFDASKKRVEGTELAKYAGKSKRPEPPKKKSNWRQQHEEFIQSLRYAKKVTQIEKTGGDLRNLTPPPATKNPDFVPCPHCGRTFNETAAERHIPRCKDLKTRPPPKNTRRR